MFRKIFFILFLSFFANKIFSADLNVHSIELLEVFKDAYPDLSFSAIYDNVKKDYLVLVHFPEMESYESIEFYWAGGRFLTEEAVTRRDFYTPILYYYPDTFEDPEKMSAEEIEKLKKDSLAESDENAGGSAMFFFDYLYDSFSKAKIESHIKEISFCGKKMKIHERLIEKAKIIEKKILESAKTDDEVQSFLDTLTVDAYFWRVIKGTDRKSFHSLGIAIDVLPKNLHGKQTYWAWARDKFGEKWIDLPFSQRWFPAKKVIEIFESEGFIWGGKWAIWDTMHFEYRPELLLFKEKYVQH